MLDFGSAKNGEPFRVRHQGDIDFSFYIDPNKMEHKAITKGQMQQLQLLMHQQLPKEAQEKLRSFADISTWHGFLL